MQLLLYEKFYKSIRWNVFESITYHGVLLGHQIALFKTIDAASYGLVGSLFSIMYMTIAITNFGLDATLSPFFILCTKSKNHFKKILIPQLIPEILLLIVIATTWYAWSPLLYPFFPALVPVGNLIPFLMGLIILSEGLKKTLRVFLQLAFLNYKTAPLEVVTLFLYCGTIWLLYGLGYTLTLPVLLVPMLMYSLLSLLILSYYMYRYYIKLPESLPITEQGLILRIIKNRFFNYLNQLSHTMFSGNFLVPLFALYFGQSLAGVFKLITTIVHTITTLLHKIFGLTIEAFFSHTKEDGIHTQREIFNTVNTQLYHALYGIIIFFIINYKTVVTAYGLTTSTITPPMIALFFIVPLSEHFFMVYEKFSITHERSYHFLSVNLVTMLLLYTVVHYGISWGPYAVLCALLIIRLLALLIMSIVSVKMWKLRPSWHFKRTYLATSLIIAGIFFALARSF